MSVLLSPPGWGIIPPRDNFQMGILGFGLDLKNSRIYFSINYYLDVYL
jgi:hypothetical protein